MKFSARTLQILRNFSVINPSIVFNAGVELKTISPSSTMMAQAIIDTPIDKTFAVYDLSQFLGAVSMFPDPDIEISETSVRITSGTERLSYTCSEPSLIQSAPNKQVVLQSNDVEFDLPDAVLTRTMKALSLIGCPEFAITGDGSTIYLEALDSRKSSSSTYRVEVGSTSKSFQFIFKSENIRMLPGDYHVIVSSKGLSHFKGADVQYWVAVEHHSKYNG